MSYRDVLARNARKRPDGTPVWPLRASETGLFTPAGSVLRLPHRNQLRVVEGDAGAGVRADG